MKSKAEILLILATFISKEIYGLVKKEGPKFWANCQKWLNGKTIAIIGATASGKNSMFSQLQKESPPAEYMQTKAAEKVKSFKINRSIGNDCTVNFKCKNSFNIPGESDERIRSWKQACEKADFIFYLIDLEKLRNYEDVTLERIKEDFKWLGGNVSQFKPGKKIYILLNKIDKIEIDLKNDDLKGHLIKLVENESEKIMNMAKFALSVNSSALSGISPITMLDEDIFNIFFDAAIVEMYRTRDDK